MQERMVMVVIAVNLLRGKPVSFKLRVAGDPLPPFFILVNLCLSRVAQVLHRFIDTCAMWKDFNDR